MTPPTADRRRTTDIGRKRKSMTRDTTTRRPGGAVTTAAFALALASIPLTTSGRADAVAARAAPTLAGAYVGGVHLGLGGATQVWPVFEPSLRHGVVSGAYGSVATDSRRPGWLGRQSRAALRVRGSVSRATQDGGSRSTSCIGATPGITSPARSGRTRSSGPCAASPPTTRPRIP